MRSMIYRSYVIRYWEEPVAEGASTSRYILEIPETGQRQGFTELTPLLQALVQMLHPPQPNQTNKSNMNE